MQPFKSVAYAAVAPGTRLIVIGAVHGNETCGTQGDRARHRRDRRRRLGLRAGRVTFVPVTNPLAYAEQAARRRPQPQPQAARRPRRRASSRTTSPTGSARCSPSTRCCSTCIRSRAPGVPFVFMGPRDNAGDDRALRPARRARRRWRARLGVGRVVDGWLTTYAAGVARRREHAAEFPEATLDLDPRYGIGTTEYMRSVGGNALTLECGQHEDPAAPEVAYRAIVNTLAHLGLIDAPDPAPAHAWRPEPVRSDRPAALRTTRSRKAWRSFDPVAEGRGDRHAPRRQRDHRAVRRLHRLPESHGRAGARVVLSRALEHAARIAPTQVSQ